MAKRKPEWKKLPHLLTIIGLVISFLANVFLVYQYIKTSDRAHRDEVRANQQEERARQLQRDKDKWVGQLKAELLQVNQKVEADSIHIVQTKKKDGDPFVNSNDIDAELDKFQNEKEKLEKRRLDLMDEITYYMTNNH